MRKSKLKTFIAGTALTALAAGCTGPPTTNTTTNMNTSAANANVSPAAAAAVTPLAVIEAREPANYRATLVLKAETAGGQRALAILSFASARR